MNTKTFQRFICAAFALAVLGALIPSAFCGTDAKSLPAAEAKSKVTAPEITEIRFWSNSPGESITLRSDGTASHIGIDRNQNLGAGEYHGSFPPGAFRRLTATFRAQSFFKLKEDYSVPYQAGLPLYTLVAATENGREKLVIASSGRGPAALTLLKTALLEADAQVSWQKGPSGIRGVLTLQGAASFPADAMISVDPLSNAKILGMQDGMRFPVDSTGHFDLPLPPGLYRLTPVLPASLAPPSPGSFISWEFMTVTVPSKSGYVSTKVICKPRFGMTIPRYDRVPQLAN